MHFLKIAIFICFELANLIANLVQVVEFVIR
ncbi:hypothetical protein F904_00151 [Acinetobacter dispersus]|uniref:Uncharacterized protein n=1 Tax=Acinetobacter dispersus TaxID=70348 RepID=N9LM57_9GAMM|nr:hypothetical protein F904_00151 [Acinetobacter dispersus]